MKGGEEAAGDGAEEKAGTKSTRSRKRRLVQLYSQQFQTSKISLCSNNQAF